MAKAVKQGLVRKAAALSGWSHFCAHGLGADVQQLQEHTELPGNYDQGQSSNIFRSIDSEVPNIPTETI